MIDIHSHLLYDVDDGAKSIEEAVAMLKEAKVQGVDAMILTPHYRHGMFAYPKEKIEEHFHNLRIEAKQIGVAIYLGTEHHVNSNMIDALRGGRCHTLADSRYVLSEYSHQSEFSYIKQMTQELMMNGYIPVIAHVERYLCLQENMELVRELQQMGAWIQVNADAILGMEGWGNKRYCAKLLKNRYIDVVASDCHGLRERASHMNKCWGYIEKKYGSAQAKKLLYTNPQKIIMSNKC